MDKQVTFRFDMPNALGHQVRMAAEMHSVTPELMLEIMIRTAVPAVMSGLVHEPIWRDMLFVEQDWYQPLLDAGDGATSAEVFNLACRLLSKELAASTMAHNAYQRALETVGTTLRDKGVAGLRSAAASLPHIVDRPGRFPIK